MVMVTPTTEEDEWEHVKRVVHERAIAGNPQAQNTFGSLMVDESVRTLNPVLLDEAEQWFAKAAKGGHMPAADFLETIWPVVKEEYRLKIQQRLSGESK
jgi:hypothetical protein